MKADYRSPIYELHERCNLDTLATHHKKSLLKLCSKWVHGDGPVELCNMMLPPDIPIKETRHSLSTSVAIPRVNTSMGKKSIKYRATKCWGSAKSEFTSCTKYDQLKNKLKMVRDTFD